MEFVSFERPEAESAAVCSVGSSCTTSESTGFAGRSIAGSLMVAPYPPPAAPGSTSPVATQVAPPAAVAPQMASTFATAATPAPRVPPAVARAAASPPPPPPRARAANSPSPRILSTRGAGALGDPLVRAAAHRLVEHRSGRHQLEDLVRDRPVGPQLGPAGGATPQMELDRVGRAIRPLAVGHLRERRGELLASATLLDVGEDLEEALAPLRHAPVDLRIGPARDLADLGVGVALRLQGQRSNLLRLQCPQRLPAAGDALPPGNSVVRARALGGDRIERIPIAVLVGLGRARRAEQPLALAADRRAPPAW